MLFVVSVVILAKRHQVSNRVIWIANCLLFATSTAHFALMFNHFYIALVRNTQAVYDELKSHIAIGKCSVRKVRKRNFCIAWSKFDDFCG